MLITSTPCCPLGQGVSFDSGNSSKILTKDSSLAHLIHWIAWLICPPPKTSRHQLPCGWVGHQKTLLASVPPTTVVNTRGRALGVCGARSKQESGGPVCSGSCFEECGAGLLIAMEETRNWTLSLSLLHNRKVQTWRWQGRGVCCALM